MLEGFCYNKFPLILLEVCTSFFCSLSHLSLKFEKSKKLKHWNLCLLCLLTYDSLCHVFMCYDALFVQFSVPIFNSCFFYIYSQSQFTITLLIHWFEILMYGCCQVHILYSFLQLLSLIYDSLFWMFYIISATYWIYFRFINIYTHISHVHIPFSCIKVPYRIVFSLRLLYPQFLSIILGFRTLNSVHL